ncbi:LmeA family phospholipid-binding protein [Microbacterium gilvum]|uniref:DUF2993 domain-containing protein n=1 Tax=Microbacterium gilvum TaxID=1336204 RepID=A0ABP9ACY1_9MICO
MASRRTARTLLIAGAVVVAAVAAFFVGDAIARAVVQDRVREAVVTELALPADHPVDVAVGGLVLPQLLAGRLDDLAISADDVAFEGLTGDVAVRAHGVPVSGDDLSALGGTARISMDADDVDALLSTAGGAWTSWGDIAVELPGPAAEFSAELTIFGASLPLEFTAVPGVADGDVVLTPDAIRIGALELTADTLAQAPIDLGALAQPLTLCRGDALPDGLDVTAADVSDGRLEIGLTFSDGVFADLDALAAARCA